ncbi:ATP-binding protein [Luteibacter anthropi]|uniref:AAA family ATPase n=1 Tax=Luteibacter anthropi TaxID=564369 RepID=UPI0020322233|nr:ATP-binding protein [Luteibacter anthropi]URX62625.1 ATP-binding protein [Luteibacter anthropi]
MYTSTKGDAAVEQNTAILHMVCGKIAAGKSTLTARLAGEVRHVAISEDVWLSRLYPDDIRSIDDYIRCSTRLKDAMAEHVTRMLASGICVVLDFPFNTVASRAWGRNIASQAGCGHRLHYLDVSDAVCLARLHARNARAEHPFQATEAEFAQITQYFVAPVAEEGLHVVVYDDEGQRRVPPVVSA